MTNRPVSQLPNFGSVTVQADRRVLPLYIDDETGTPVDLTGGNATLMGSSRDLPAIAVSVAGTIIDAKAGKVQFAPGSAVSQANLTSAGKKLAAYQCYVKYTDIAGKVDFTDPFVLTWVQQPTELP